MHIASLKTERYSKYETIIPLALRPMQSGSASVIIYK